MQASQAGTPITVWVKRTDVAGARYDFIKYVDPEQLVAELIARWVVQAKLDVDPSLVTLRLVKCGARKPTAEEEAQTEVLEPFDTLAAAGVTDNCKLVAFVAGANTVRLSAGVGSLPGARILRVHVPAAKQRARVACMVATTDCQFLPSCLWLQTRHVRRGVRPPATRHGPAAGALRVAGVSGGADVDVLAFERRFGCTVGGERQDSSCCWIRRSCEPQRRISACSGDERCA